MICWRSDLIFHNLQSASDHFTSKVESTMLKLKIGNSWTVIAGVYRPPSVNIQIWKQELLKLFECASSHAHDMLFLGDFNCDLLHADNKPEAKELSDLSV